MGVSDKSLYLWVRLSKEQQSVGSGEAPAMRVEIARLKAELKRASEERDILKKGRNVLCQAVRVKCAFMAKHHGQFRLSSMCRVLRVQRSGYCACKDKPKSDRALADDVMLVSIKRFFRDSHGICGSPRVHRDRVGVPATAAPDRLQREFTVTQPDQVWVTGITHIRTDEGWLYLTVVIDLPSRRVVGWAMGASMATELVLGDSMMAVWRRRPKAPGMIYSDQGSQFGSDGFNRWCKDNQLVPSMGRRGNSWDNAVAAPCVRLAVAHLSRG